jgi:TonB family protein
MASFGADPEPLPYLKTANMPFYPRIALTARIAGFVSLRATVNAQGETSEVEAIGGHPLLQQSAIENVKSWKFAWPNPCACTAKKEITFVYTLSGRTETNRSPTSVVKWFGIRRVEIEADVPHWQP